MNTCISLYFYILYTLLLLNTSNLYFRTPRCSIFGLLHPPKEGQNSILWKTTAISGFQVQPPFPIPICSMYALVTYVEQPLYCKCRQIFHTWIIWDINGLELWKKKTFIQDIPNRTPTEQTPKKTWVSNSSIATYWKGSAGKVPFSFCWNL